MNYRIILAFCGLLLVAACAPQKETLSPLDSWAIRHHAARPVTCNAGKDCDEKWGRAIEWVRANSAPRIKTINDNMIQTYNIYPGGREAGGFPAFTIIKYPKGKGVYAIDYDSACDEIANYECNPSAIILKATFVFHVMGPEHFKAPATNAQ